MSKRIVYHPPSRQVIDQFARTVCEKLAERNIAYLSPEVVAGLSRFLQLAADIQAKYLNAESEREDKFDNKAD